MENRLDVELVKRNIFETRNKAKEEIINGTIFCDGKKITKPSFVVFENTKIELIGDVMPYVSKGGLKLEKAIKCFSINLENKCLLDIGSSTGGFCDCAIQNGVGSVIAVDVGDSQLHEKIKNNNKVTFFENTDFRMIDIIKVKDANFITIDVSFISIIKLIPKISELKNVETVICLIKPQFECGKEIASKYKGVILNKEVHSEVIEKVITEFKSIGFYCNGLTYSPIRGGSGNIEYLAYFNRSTNYNYNVKETVNEAFEVLK